MTDVALPSQSQPRRPPRKGGLREYRERFTALPAPSLDSLAGRYRGEFVGPLWLRLCARPLLALLGMPGWWGKELAADGRGVNLVKGEGGPRPSVPLVLCNGPSKVDGRWGVRVEYPREAAWHWRLFVDELRWTDGRTLLAQTHLKLPWVGRVTLPFLLHRVESPA
jgi:hypothetical protein